MFPVSSSACAAIFETVAAPSIQASHSEKLFAVAFAGLPLTSSRRTVPLSDVVPRIHSRPATHVEFVSNARVFEFAQLSGSMDPPAVSSKLAIVATSDLHFGLARMYQAYRASSAKGTKVVGVFRTRDEALNWLGASITPIRT